MRKFLLITIVFTALSFQAKAQQVIASSGGYFENENLALSFTVGEPITETYTNGDLMLTQGFQQPYNFYLSQILNIPMGWSGISSYLDPLNKGVEGIFSPVQNDLIIMASMNRFYSPAQGVNTLGNWSYETGYKIKAENDFDLTITGSKIENPAVDLAEGWNILPVLSMCDVDVENLFSGFQSLQIVKDVAGTELYWPAYNINTIGNLVPGKAYFVAIADAGTIIFPECAKSSPNQQTHQKPVNNTPWNDLNYTATSHTIAFPGEVFTGTGIMTGDVIGAFTPEGLCAGRLEISNPNSNMAITAFAKDEITAANDGFETGEMLQFKVYRPAQDQEFELDVTYDPSLPNMGQFAINGLSAVQSLKLQSLGVAEKSEIRFEVYPNPSHGEFKLSMNSWPENLQIQIIDSRAQIIESFELSKKTNGSFHSFDLSHLPKGVYFMKLSDNGNYGVKKIVIN